jgi:signal transduction histidine kinase
VSAAIQADNLVIRVKDTGIGIAPEDVPRVFEPFERLGRDSVAGAGLGLAIAQHIVELHGGSLTASSVPGVGSTFVVWLPMPSPSGVSGPESRP